MPALDLIEIVQGDITQLDVDVIVNAANKTLLGGGGVDGAIHRAAGPGLLEACRPLGGCETGQAKVTAGFNLLARHLIHTVGPIWQGGDKGEPRDLVSCYLASLGIAQKLEAQSIAFPCISTGVYWFPPYLAARYEVAAIARYLTKHPEWTPRVILCAFDEGNLQFLNDAKQELVAKG
jgi:O-acetyl-ADP-ribose deacetylase (regulator of RNase III)